MTKQVYTWGKVTAGDIISFRYKGKKATGTLTTLLVLNPRIPYKRKDGTKTFHLNGLKLESRGNIPTIKSKPMVVQLLERFGDIQVVDGENGIFRINLPNTGPRGVTKNIYNKLKNYINKYSVYRTYDYMEAKKSAVFLEPIALPKALVEVLVGN
jgi:hypothetical protein|tara:strand:+ start:47 stop:511 length:465 start_codon:yes stop_codon:yes gene_type:complete